MRVVGGRLRGRNIVAPASRDIRPTADRLRESVFNILMHAYDNPIEGARVLDLFAGSGALGLEALSRGAREALLVERDAGLAESLRQTVARLHANEEAQVVAADALAFLRVPLHGRFDIVFVDPPFAAGLWPGVFAALPPWLAGEAWLYAESPVAGGTPEPGDHFRLHREGRTREARHALYRRATLPPDPSEPGAPRE